METYLSYSVLRIVCLLCIGNAFKPPNCFLIRSYCVYTKCEQFMLWILLLDVYMQDLVYLIATLCQNDCY